MSEYEHIIHNAVSAVDRMGRKLRDVGSIVDANRDLRIKVHDALSEALGIDPAAHSLGEAVRLAAQRIHDLTAERDSLARAVKTPAPVTWERSSPEEVPPVYPGCWVRTAWSTIGAPLSRGGSVLFDEDGDLMFFYGSPSVGDDANTAPIRSIVAVGPTRESVQAPKKPEPLADGDSVLVSVDMSSGEFTARVRATFDDKVVVHNHASGLHIVHRSNVRRAE